MKVVSRVCIEDTRRNISGHCGSRRWEEGLKSNSFVVRNTQTGLIEINTFTNKIRGVCSFELSGTLN